MGGPSEGACSYTRPQEPSSAMMNCERTKESAEDGHPVREAGATPREL